MARMNGRRAGRGFTLIETVVSLVLLGALVGLASVSLLGVAPKYRLQKGVWEILSALNAARSMAVYEGVECRVRIEAEGYAIEKRRFPQNDWVMDARRTLEGVACSANNIPLFTPEGTVSGLATIIIANAAGSYKLTIAITGRIKTARLT